MYIAPQNLSDFIHIMHQHVTIFIHNIVMYITVAEVRQHDTRQKICRNGEYFCDIRTLDMYVTK